MQLGHKIGTNSIERKKKDETQLKKIKLKKNKKNEQSQPRVNLQNLQHKS
jgi:hypothetical protein